jgi:hypothetical protein
MIKCEQFFSASNTHYMTIHGNTIPFPIYRGTIQGDTLSPFLSAIIIEPLLRWLADKIRDYKPIYQ